MFAKKVIEQGGSIHPLLIDSKYTEGTGTTNPSIYTDENNLLFNVRHVEYSLYHAEKKKYCHPWGPLQYLHRENDMHLRTNNFFGKLKSDFTIDTYSKIDTSAFDKAPIWEFVGLEDIRIVRWNGKLYVSGVRRDTTPNGQGRMELSEIVYKDGQYKEVSRFRIPAPESDSSYCEKNWMPVLDMPFHYVKWCNPTQVVKVDIEKETCETVFLGSYVPYNYDFRGGSQILTYGDYRFCLTHIFMPQKSETGRKDGMYKHAFVVWDKDWNIVKYGEPFSFLEGKIEFCCGASFWKNDLLITFGFQDNSAFLLRLKEETYKKMILPSKRMIVDFFPYFHSTGEELLELRINMLKDYVDKFIICESNKTQSGIPIEYSLQKTIEKLNLPKEKIQVIKLEIPDDNQLKIEDIDKINCYEGNDKNLTSVQARVRERLQKDSLLSVLNDYDDNTVFIVSDSDEIIKPESIKWVADMVTKHSNVLIKIPLVHLEGRADLQVFDKSTNTPKQWDKGMFVCIKQHLLNATPTMMRSNVYNPYYITYLTQNGERIEDLGWHFSWMGDSNRRKIKRESFTHYSDTLSYLGDTSYKDTNVINLVETNNLQEGDTPPSGDTTCILKNYDTSKLPELILNNSKFNKFFLNSNNKNKNFTILIKFPTRERPKAFFETLDLYIKRAKNIEKIIFLITCDLDDKAMNNIDIIHKLDSYKKHYNFYYFFGASKNKVQAFNADIEKIDTNLWDIIITGSEDLYPVENYDDIIRNDFNTYFSDTDGIMWYSDGIQNNTMTCFFAGKKYYQRFNYINHPSYCSLYGDNEVTEVAYKLNRYHKKNQVILEHKHPAYGHNVYDDLYIKNEKYEELDKANFLKRKKFNFYL